ncbi:F-box/LRR-repeat protein At4g14103-like [Carex rostrata]
MMNIKRCDIDRISCLPDEILTYILSFLSTRNAVQTCILSKRWTNTWASVPVLEFDIDEFVMPKTIDDMYRFWNSTLAVKFVTKFELLVKSVLEKRDTSCVINRFRLRLDCCGIYLPYTQIVADCITDAMKLEPRKCSIILHLCANVNLNTDLIFTCASIIDLQLRLSIKGAPHIAIKPNSINFPCLKTLNLRGSVSISDDFVKKLLLGCPVLEELVLSCPVGIIEICSNTLKKLVIRDWYDGNRLHVCTPYLLYFEIHIIDIYPILDIGEILLINMPSLADVFIYIPNWYDVDYDEYDYISGVPKLIASFSNLESLKLKFDCTDEKALKKELSNCPIFSNLKCLKLVSLGFYVFDLAPFFLHRSPKLQELTLQNFDSWATAPERLSDALVQRAWATTPEGPSDALVQREFLKTVRIVRFKNDNGFVDQLLNILSVHVKIIGEIKQFC